MQQRIADGPASALLVAESDRAADGTPASRPPSDASLRLLQIEAEIRRKGSQREVLFHAVNETRPLLDYRMASAFVMRGKALRAIAVSGVSVVDPDAQMVRDLETVARACMGEATSAIVALPTEIRFQQGLWSPLRNRDGALIGGILYARERPWRERNVTLAARLADTYGHALAALTAPSIFGFMPRPSRKGRLAAVCAVLLALAIPFPVTAIAPVEVVGKAPFVVAAPLDGVVGDVLVEPNQPVRRGDLLARMQDTELRNAADIAAQKAHVAAARLAQTSSSAFTSLESRRDLAVAQAEFDLAQTEKALADDRLSRTAIRAQVDGLAIFGDAQEWTGKPVATGERIMSIADPANVQYKIALAVDDLIAMEGEERVRVFLDADPLAVRHAVVTRASFHAVRQPDGVLAYEVFGDDAERDAAGLRIGARGTAQIAGRYAPLVFVILRRPLAWLRQTTGI